MEIQKIKMRIYGIIFLALLLSLSFVSAVELDLKINAQIDDFDADFYAQTDTGSSSGLDYMDSELRSYPSGNYSFLYSEVSSYDFIIDSWPAASNPRTLNLVYETSPTTVAGTIVFSWNSPGSGYTATLYDYGNTGYSTILSTVAMNSQSSYSTTTSFSGGKRYLQLKIETVSSGTGTGTGSGGGTTTIEEPEKECTPSCPFTSEVSCGQALGSNGCGGTCGGTGTKCVLGICNLALGKCLSCTDTCSSFEFQCGTHSICDISTNCGLCALGQTCNAAGKCVLAKECKDTCSSLGYECGTHTICDVEKACGSCSGGKVCNSGKCGDGQKITKEEIPLEVPRKVGCEPNVVCGDFGDCSANYNVYNLITGDQVNGIRSRECIDKNNCVANFLFKEPCTLKQEVYTVNKVWCGKNYTEVRDASGKVVARLRKLADGRAVSVDFNLESEGYCPSCYDGVQNGDEIDVDCGGSCIACNYQKESIAWYKDSEFLLFLSLLLFLIFLIAFSGVAVQTYRYYKDRIMLHIWMRRYHGWKRKGYDAGVLHKDYHAIKKHYDVLKRRLN